VLQTLQINGLQVCSVNSITLGGVNPHPSMLEVYHQYREIGDVPNPGTKIPGQAGKHQCSACQPPCRQGETDTDRSHHNLQHGLPLSSLALPLPGEAQLSNPGYSSSPTILLLPADRLTSSSQQQQSGSSVPITTLPISWRRQHLFKWNGKPLKDKSDQVTISSDASLLSWGGI